MTMLWLIAAGILLQAYAGYPFSLVVLRLVLGDRSRHATGGRLPTVTLVISAYNEERVIRRKLDNSLALDYPHDRIQRLVVSDGSTDRTEEMVGEYAPRGISLKAFAGRRGKVACLNAVVPDLTTELVVMSDANSMYEPQSLRELVRHFEDERIGCVCGELRYSNLRRLAAGEGERCYWSYERFVKRCESALGSLLGANGAIYAFRRTLFRPVDPLMFCDDVIPIRIALDGRLVIYEPAARCTEEAADEAVEMNRRRRHASFGMRSMLYLARQALRQGRPFVLYQCLSHRVLRWLTGVALVALLLLSPFLPGGYRVAALTAQVLFYAWALVGFLASRRRASAPLIYVPYYFLALAGAGIAGLVSVIRRTDRPFWEPRK